MHKKLRRLKALQEDDIPTKIIKENSDIFSNFIYQSFMDLSKRRILLNAFFTSQFSYCPLVSMFHSRGKINKVNRIHERCLRIIRNNEKSTFHELLEKDGSVSIHKRNLRFLACEMFKLKTDMVPE